jgi:hypothetical protein
VDFRSTRPETWCAALATLCAAEFPIASGSLHDPGAVWLAGLRLAVAAAGAFLLARKLGLALPGASLAALGFGSSGFLVCRVDSPAGHAALFLPWILAASESARVEPVRAWRSWIAITLLALLSILGGELAVAALGFSAAVVWILAGWRLDARAAAGSLAALAVGIGVSVLAWPPLAAELRSADALARRGAHVESQRFDFVALALVLIATGIALSWRTLVARDGEETPAREGSSGRERASFAGIAGVALRGCRKTP